MRKPACDIERRPISTSTPAEAESSGGCRLTGLEITQLILRIVDGGLSIGALVLLIYISSTWHWNYDINYAATAISIGLDVLTSIAIVFHIPRRHLYLGVCVVLCQLTTQVLLVISIIAMLYASHIDPSAPPLGSGDKLPDQTVYHFPAAALTTGIFWIEITNEGLGFMFMVLECVNWCRERK